MPRTHTTQANPASAESILVDVGLWTTHTQKQQQQQQSAGVGREETKTDGETTNYSNDGDVGDGEEAGLEESEGGAVVPWSVEALQAAAALGKERAKRAANYGKREPQGKVGTPAPFGR